MIERVKVQQFVERDFGHGNLEDNARLLDHPTRPTLIFADHPPTLKLFSEIKRVKRQGIHPLTMIANGFSRVPLAMSGIELIPVIDAGIIKRSPSAQAKIIRPIIHLVSKLSNPGLSQEDQVQRVTNATMYALQNERNVMICPASDKGVWGESVGMILKGILDWGMNEDFALSFLYLIGGKNSNVIFDNFDTAVRAFPEIKWKQTSRRLSREVGQSFERTRLSQDESTVIVAE